MVSVRGNEKMKPGFSSVCVCLCDTRRVYSNTEKRRERQSNDAACDTEPEGSAEGRGLFITGARQVTCLKLLLSCTNFVGFKSEFLHPSQVHEENQCQPE